MRRIPILLPFLLAACGTTPSSSTRDGETAAAPTSAAPAAARPEAAAFDLRGFAVFEDDGRLWVFRDGSKDLQGFLENGEPAKRVTLVGVGPEGKTLYGAETGELRDFANSWKYRMPGFVVLGAEGRLWVFREGGEAYAQFLAKGEPAKRVTLIGAGPDNKTLYGTDTDTLRAYVGSLSPQ